MNPISARLLLAWCSLTWATPAECLSQNPPRRSPPVLSFPEPGLDDSAAYAGYKTRFHRDARGNTIQIYLDGRSGRIVHLWADAEDESIALSARDASGAPATLRWDDPYATTEASGRVRSFEYHIAARGSRVDLGLFLLGSMRVERDFQYQRRHRAPLDTSAFVLPEMTGLLDALNSLDVPRRQDQLALLNATSVSELSRRLVPVVTGARNGSAWIARVVQPSLDGRDTLALEIRALAGTVRHTSGGDIVSISAGANSETKFALRIFTTGKALTPLSRQEIFAPAFRRFLAAERRADSMSPRTRWLERNTRGVELLSSQEKLMAGLPAYATYFGRDMLVSALMMRPIWRSEMSAFAIASVLRKLGPNGEVSHEEALGGQADRESASEYAGLVRAHLRAAEGGDRRAADTLLRRATAVLRGHRTVRENYHMIDNAFQLPVLEARWLRDSAVSRAEKRAFLLTVADGEPRVRRMLRQLALVARLAAPYADNPVAANLVSFPQRDATHWQSASWRDSEDGYAGGRFAMDVNAIWVPHALEATRVIVRELRRVGIAADSVLRAMRDDSANAALLRYATDSAALRRAISVWQRTADAFVVRLSPSEVRTRVTARLAALPDAERRYWSNMMTTTGADRDSLVFLALSLDAAGTPVAVANSDPSTRLFLLDDVSDSARDDVLRDVRLFARSFPVGLFIEGVGPVVANDAYASPSIWPRFEQDTYHGPRVVWGREVNLFLLGVMNQLSASGGGRSSDELQRAIDRVEAAVAASGFHSELWSYRVRDGRVEPLRYDTGSDIQLWSTTDLAVEFARSRLRARSQPRPSP